VTTASVCGGGINNSSEASNSRKASKQNSQSAQIQENFKINVTCTEIIKYERLAEVRSEGETIRSAEKVNRLLPISGRKRLNATANVFLVLYLADFRLAEHISGSPPLLNHI
jgi:hypothetical protein